MGVRVIEKGVLVGAARQEVSQMALALYPFSCLEQGVASVPMKE